MYETARIFTHTWVINTLKYIYNQYYSLNAAQAQQGYSF